MPEDSKIFCDMVRQVRFNAMMDDLVQSTLISQVNKNEFDAALSLSNRLRLITKLSGISVEILKGSKEKPKPKLLTRFQILKKENSYV